MTIIAPQCRLSDPKKARWYLDYEIRMLEAEHNEN